MSLNKMQSFKYLSFIILFISVNFSMSLNCKIRTDGICNSEFGINNIVLYLSKINLKRATHFHVINAHLDLNNTLEDNNLTLINTTDTLSNCNNILPNSELIINNSIYKSVNYSTCLNYCNNYKSILFMVSNCVTNNISNIEYYKINNIYNYDPNPNTISNFITYSTSKTNKYTSSSSNIISTIIPQYSTNPILSNITTITPYNTTTKTYSVTIKNNNDSIIHEYNNIDSTVMLINGIDKTILYIVISIIIIACIISVLIYKKRCVDRRNRIFANDIYSVYPDDIETNSGGYTDVVYHNPAYGYGDNIVSMRNTYIYSDDTDYNYSDASGDYA